MAFDFFRKHQKVILYTAGIFALVSFSISGALLSFFAPSAQEGFDGAEMTLPDDRKVRVTYEDWVVGQWMKRAAVDPTVVLPGIAAEEDDQGVRARYAALRRLAIEFGIEASLDEVEVAIATGAGVMKKGQGWESPTQYAVRQGFRSLDGYRQMLAEAMRIGLFLRLQLLGADTTDKALAEFLVEDVEQVRLRVASLSKKEKEDELRDVGVTDEDLTAWLDELEDAARVPYQDTNHVALGSVGLKYADFDPAEFTAELDGVEWTEDQLKQEYEFRKETHFRRPVPEAPKKGAGNPKGKGKKGKGQKGKGQKKGPKQGAGTKGAKKGTGKKAKAPAKQAENAGGKGGLDLDSDPFDRPDSAVPGAQNPGQGGGTQGAGAPEQGAPKGAGNKGGSQSPTPAGPPPAPDPYFAFEEVKDKLKRMLQAEAVLDALRNGSVQDEFAEHMSAQVEAHNSAVRDRLTARKALEEAEKKLAEDEEDEALKKAVDEAKAAVEAKEEAEKAATEALDKHRAAFDFPGAIAKQVGARKGLVTHSIDSPVGIDGLKELGELGVWNNTFTATSMDADGDISTLVQKTKVGCFHFQVLEVVKNPLRPFEDIKEKARSDYFAKKADEFAKEKSELLEKRLLELAKEKIADKVAEIEKNKTEEIDKEFEAWVEERKAKVAEAEKRVAEARPGTEGRRIWEAEQRKRVEALEKKDEERKTLEEAYEKKTEDEVAAEAKKVYKDILEAAAAEAGFTVKTLPPFSSKLSAMPRFRKRYPEDVVFLFGGGVAEPVSELEEGEVTDVLEDVAGRALHIAVCEERKKATVETLTRREFEAGRDRFLNQRMLDVFNQSFSMEALEKRWGYKSADVSEGEEARAVAGSDGDEAKK